MSFNDVASRFKKINEQKQSAQQETAVDPQEVYAIRARMLGVLIRDARTASGYSLEELAERLGVAPTTLSEWEYGESVPSLPQVELVAYILQVPISHFWGAETFARQRASREIDGQEYTLVRDRMIGLMITTARQNRNITSEALADKLGTGVEALEAYESGEIPVPMPVLVSLSSHLGVSLSHFLEDNGRVGEFLERQQATELFARMPDDIREFLAVPSNEAYIRVAMTLAHIPTESLRSLAEGLIDITM